MPETQQQPQTMTASADANKDSNAAAPEKFQVVFVLGGPGAGKGTQCSLVCEHCEGWATLSAGDLLRAERKDPNSEHGKTIEERISQGQIVPAEITVNLILREMRRLGCAKVLVDGYPRNMDNVTAWESVVGDQAAVCGVMYFDVNEDLVVGRILERSKKESRGDDDPAILKKRFETNRRECEPIVKMYREKCNNVIDIDGGAGSPSEVFEVVKKHIADLEGKM